MTLETKTTLTQATLDTLQDLIQVNLDSQSGLKDAADSVNDPVVDELFRSVLSERLSFADELKLYVEWNDESACDEQSWSGKVHQLWMDVRAKLNSGDSYVILIEAERGEDHIKSAYEDALKGNPGSAVSEILHHQYAVVKRGHDRIRILRDIYEEKP